MKADEIFKKVTEKEEIKDIPLTDVTRVTLAVLEVLFDNGCVMRNDYV